MNVESANQIARALELEPQLDTLRLRFPTRLSPAVIKTLFEVPALQRLSEIEVGGGASRAIWDRFFASPYVRNVKRLEIGGEHAAGFSRAPWPELVHLRVGIDGTAGDRKALARILASDVPRLATLELDADGFGVTGVEVVVRSAVFPQLVTFVLRESPIGDAGVAALARRKTRLAAVGLSLESITKRGIVALAKLANRLDRIELVGCPLGDAELHALAKVPHLRSLGFFGTPSAEALREVLPAMVDLEKLVFGLAYGLGPSHCEAIAKVRSLRRLRITYAPIGAEGARALAKLASLVELDLQSSGIGDDGAAALSRLHDLRDLDLQFCEIGDRGGTAIADWPADAALQTINLNGNHILDPAIQTSLKARFASVHPVKVIGVQRPAHAVSVVDEPTAPQQRHQARLPPRRRNWRAGLRELVGRNHFAGWDGYVDANLITKSEALIDRCAEHILSLGKDASETAQRAVLERCIAGFNRFSDRIYTIEAEDIVGAFEAVVRYTKLSKVEDLADEWRDF